MTEPKKKIKINPSEYIRTSLKGDPGLLKVEPKDQFREFIKKIKGDKGNKVQLRPMVQGKKVGLLVKGTF